MRELLTLLTVTPILGTATLSWLELVWITYGCWSLWRGYRAYVPVMKDKQAAVLSGDRDYITIGSGDESAVRRVIIGVVCLVLIGVVAAFTPPPLESRLSGAPTASIFTAPLALVAFWAFGTALDAITVARDRWRERRNR